MAFVPGDEFETASSAGDPLACLQEVGKSARCVLFSTTLQHNFSVENRLLDHLHDASQTETEHVYVMPVSEEISEGTVVCDVSQKKQDGSLLLPKVKMAAK